MIRQAKISGRRRKDDFRDIRLWCDRLDMSAQLEGQQFVLAALYRILRGADDPKARKAWSAICDYADEVRGEFRAQEREHGVMIQIKSADDG